MATRFGHTATLLLCATLVAILGSGRASAQCVGDCNGDGEVTINELILGVNIALGNKPLSECPAADANGDGEVTIGELIQAVKDVINGC